MRGEALESVGRARRSRCERGELWELPLADRAVAARILALGQRGVGGFVDGGVDGEHAWLVRALGAPTLSRWLREREGPVPWRDAAARARNLASALAACEAEGLFPGPLRPRTVWVEGERCGLWAEPLVRALCGAPAEDGHAQTSADRWMPAEQASGAPWDNAANRYVLGLVLHRMIAGEHPFEGKGLRLGLEERAGRGAPPFDPAIARELPPGLQSLCLRMLHPTPAERPASAAAIVEALDALLAPATPRVSVRAEADDPEPRAPATPRAPASRARSARVAIALAAAVGLALGGAFTALSEPRPPSRDRIAARPPLDLATATAETCAGCHPMQASEWQRSVMAHSARSPLFLALEILIEEQVGRELGCEHGAGILREAAPGTACVDRSSGLPVTGSGGALWCVNCHAPGENLREAMPPWDGRSESPQSRRPLDALLPAATLEGIGCAFCHQAHGPVRPGDLARGRYEGNPFWTSPQTGQRFLMRPEDARGLEGIANSGYSLDPAELLAAGAPRATLLGGVHARPSEASQAYLRSSEFCGACHDVRLFGSDGLSREPFKRLRNAYTEWTQWARTERVAGREPATCQDCHMSRYPGVCVPSDGAAGPALASALARACPPGTRFEPRPPGDVGEAFVSASSATPVRASPHYFSGVDVPLGADFVEELIGDATLDVRGIPRGARERRDLLLGSTFRFELGPASRAGGRLEVPVILENVGAGHRVPAGFSQEREIWVHLRITDASGALVYEVGRVEGAAEDLRDKVFLRVRTDDSLTDGLGRPLGLFGADIADGPDVPRWETLRGGTGFRGQGLVNLQNGFLRCVTCIGVIDASGRCQPVFGQGRTRADRYADGAFDADTGLCTSNLVGEHAFLETYFPVGSLDADRGVLRGPDAIVDTRSAPPGVPLTYTYELPIGARPGPLAVEARLLFRAFPPFLIRAFAAYERQRAAAGERPGGPLVTDAMLERLEVVELARVEATIP